MIHLGDITRIHGAGAPIVEVIIGGSPCQDLSVAGKRAGLAGERSGLFMDQVRIVKEMRDYDARVNARTGNDVRPRYMVWENVPGAFSSNGGEDFRAVLEEIARVVEKDAVIPEPPNGKWQTAGCIVGDGWSIAWRVLDAQFWGVPQRRKRIALVADFNGGTAGDILFDPKLQRKAAGGDQDAAFGCAGGDTAPEILFEREGLSGDSQKSGAAWEGTAGDAEGSIDETINVMAFEPGIASRDGGHCYDEISGTLRAEPGDNRMAICIQGNCIDRADTADRPAVYCASGFGKYKNGLGTLRASGGDYGGGTETLVTTNLVRRLTPLECERLQGYPDGWTDIGEWIDSKGKKHESSDSARYKALGNSIALPPWRFVLSRVNAYLKEHTMASLFDGIGGFPLIWQDLNGPGKCLWASEIEEFPIAVTKRRLK